MKVEGAPNRRAVVSGGAKLLAALAVAPLGGCGREDIAARAARLGAAQGLRVGYGDPATFFTPPATSAAIRGVTLAPATPASIGDALDGVEAAFGAYPPDFLGKLVAAIFVAGRVVIDGAQAGGVGGPAWVVLAAPADVSRGARVETARLGVHHETSSFVWSRDAELRQRWAETLPPGWSFASAAADQIARADKPPPPPETGFLTSYGATTPENDFNTYAETAFDAPATLTSRARDTSLTARKLALLLAAYIRIDARLARTFEMTRLAGAAQPR